MSSCFRVVFVVVVLSLLASRAPADSPFRLQAGATTAKTAELTSTPGFTLGGAVALTRWAPLAGVAFVPQLELLFARRSASALADGAGYGSSAADVLELPLVLRGELTIGSRTFHVMGGGYGSVLLRAQTMDDSGMVERAEASSPVDIGWVAAGGFTLASLASGELSIEMRYQRGYRGFLLDGEGGAQSLSLLLAYGLRPRGSDLRSAGNPDPSLAFKGGLVATRLQLSGSPPSDYRPGFAFGGSYSPFRLGSWIALMPQVELSFVRRNAAETGPADSSLAMDSIDLSVLARGELVASGRTVYGIGGIYGSLLFDAQRDHEGRITDMGDTLSSVDAGWLVGAGIEPFSVAAVKPAVELRYQRGFRNLLPAGPGEVHQQSLSCLVSITYGGSSPAGSKGSVPGALHGSDDDRATQTPSTRRVTSVRIGYPGDRWLVDLQFTRIARATRDGVHGYEVTYNIAGHDDPVVLFWPRDRIDFDNRPRGSLLATRKLGTDRLRYPRRITRRSLPAVHAGILQIEAAYAKYADGEISAMRGFELIAALGAVRPIPHTTATTSTRATASRGSNNAVRPSSTGPTAGGTAARGGPKLFVNAQIKATNLLRPGGRLIGRAGSSSRIRLLEGGQAEARALFKQLVQETGARPITNPRFPGTLVELPGGGGRIGFRAISGSGPPTIDVFIKGLGIREIKFLAP